MSARSKGAGRSAQRTSMISQRRYSTSPARAMATSSGRLAIPSDSATSCERAHRQQASGGESRAVRTLTLSFFHTPPTAPALADCPFAIARVGIGTTTTANCDPEERKGRSLHPRLELRPAAAFLNRLAPLATRLRCWDERQGSGSAPTRGEHFKRPPAATERSDQPRPREATPRLWTSPQHFQA